MPCWHCHRDLRGWFPAGVVSWLTIRPSIVSTFVVPWHRWCDDGFPILYDELGHSLTERLQTMVVEVFAIEIRLVAHGSLVEKIFRCDQWPNNFTHSDVFFYFSTITLVYFSHRGWFDNLMLSWLYSKCYHFEALGNYFPYFNGKEITDKKMYCILYTAYNIIILLCNRIPRFDSFVIATVYYNFNRDIGPWSTLCKYNNKLGLSKCILFILLL